MQYLSELRIDLEAIRFNLARIREKVGKGVEIMAVVKANAYSHGAETIAAHLEQWGICSFIVAHVFEAIKLRESGITSRILVWQPGYIVDPESYVHYNLETTINSLESLNYWRPDHEVRCHLVVDTGMGREGIMPHLLDTALQRIEAHPGLDLVGFASHLATADEEDPTFTQTQLARFKKLVARIPVRQREQIQIHCANSGAVINHPESHYDMVRPGIALYGQYNGSGAFHQKPAMSVYGRLTLVKDVPADYPVGYGCTWRTPAPTRLGVISIGYADGYLWRKSGAATVWKDGRAYDVVGRISMDSIVINLKDDQMTHPGDAFLLMGGSHGAGFIHDARETGTLPYERCCQMAARLPFVYQNVSHLARTLR